MYHVACVVAFIKYYAHTNGAQNFVMDCSDVVGGVVAHGLPVTMYELGLFHTTHTIFKFYDGHENFLPYGKHTTMWKNVNQHHIKT